MGRGRHCRVERRPTAPVPVGGFVERRRSDPQGAVLRTHQCRGQPRRRSSRSTTSISTARPPTRICACCTSTPRPPTPTTTWCSTNRERTRADFEYELLDTGVFAEDRYFDVEVEYAKADPEDLVGHDHRDQPRARRRRPRRAGMHLVPQHLGDRAAEQSSPSWQGLGPAGSWPTTPSSAAGCCGSTRRPSASSPRTKPTRPGCSAARIALPTSRTASTITWCTAALMPSIRRRTGTKAAARHRLVVPAGGVRTVRWRLRPADAAQVDGGALGRRSRRGDGPAPGRGGRVLRGHHPAGCRPDETP